MQELNQLALSDTTQAEQMEAAKERIVKLTFFGADLNALGSCGEKPLDLVCPRFHAFLPTNILDEQKAQERAQRAQVEMEMDLESSAKNDCPSGKFPGMSDDEVTSGSENSAAVAAEQQMMKKKHRKEEQDEAAEAEEEEVGAFFSLLF